MTDVELGQANYSPSSGEWSGDDMAAAAQQLHAGDVAKATITFPVPINFLPGDWLAALLGPIFSLQGQMLQGVDFDGTNTLILVWRVG
jgi:hypothetical protein